MNSSTVLLLPIAHRILAQRENGRFGPEQVLQSKRQGTRSIKLIVALLNPVKGDQYGIPDFSCRRSSDGALRADHRWLPETARMVTAFEFALTKRIRHGSRGNQRSISTRLPFQRIVVTETHEHAGDFKECSSPCTCAKRPG